MSREEFLKELERLLSGISEEERADALAFYRSYFEDAGESNEASILKELESPQKVADTILRDLRQDADQPGAGGASGGRDGSEDVFDSGSRDGSEGISGTGGWDKSADFGFDGYGGAGSYNAGGYGGAGTYGGDYGAGGYGGTGGYRYTGERKSGAAVTVGVIVAVLTSPIWLSLLLVAAGVLLAVVATLFGLALAVVCVMAALVVTGFMLFVTGIGLVFGGNPAVGTGLMGGGLIVLALGLLSVLLMVWVFGVLLPWALRGLWRLCRTPFDKRKERAAV